MTAERVTPMPDPSLTSPPALAPAQAGPGARPRRASALMAALAGAGLMLSACSTNPATGERQFTALMSTEQEKKIGAEQHQKIMQEFGGPLKNREVQNYVDQIGQRLAKYTERPDVQYTFTVLDSPVVNAFALPGGYVYVTRGLMSLANNEAQLAGVIGHEIGHVTARHSAQRQSTGTVAQIGAVLATIFGGQQIGQLAQAGAGAALAGFSRGHELEADDLGIRYMSGAGYDPLEMAEFLESMGRNSQLEALLAGRPGKADQFSYLQTHPPTGQRVEKASAAASQRPRQEWDVNAQRHMQMLDGMTYGDSPEHGFVRGQTFAHPQLGFRFDVPEGFRLLNGETKVVAAGPQGSGAQIVFDAAPGQGARSPEEFIQRVWAAQANLQGGDSFEVNGLPAATAVTQANSQSGPIDVRLVAIRWDADTYYRFMFLSVPQATRQLTRDFQETVNSFRKLTERDRRGLRPYRIQVVQVRQGDTVQDFVRRMPFEDYPEERFRVLNNIAPGTQLQPGQLIKVVVEG